MSSPIAQSVKGFFKKLLIQFHQKASHNYRIEKLSTLIAGEINKLALQQPIRCLDVGCGDMILSESIQAKLSSQTNWTCIDIHPLPESLINEPKWKKYQQFDGRSFPFDDHSFDIIVICDVLHHDIENTVNLLSEAKRAGKYIFIKDHYEYGFFSRKMLRLMDFVGNWAYGVPIPDFYFTNKSFKNACLKANLHIIKEVDNINLYEHSRLFNALTKPKWQFIAILN